MKYSLIFLPLLLLLPISYQELHADTIEKQVIVNNAQDSQCGKNGTSCSCNSKKAAGTTTIKTGKGCGCGKTSCQQVSSK